MNRKPVIIILIVLVIVLVIPLSAYLTWSLKPEKNIEILIVNKSISSCSRDEHKAAFWVLNQNRFIRDSGSLYDHREDYFGFFPLKPFKMKEYEIKRIRQDDIDSLASHYDMAWFVDTYGLSLAEWYGPETGNSSSRMLYGGLTHNDYFFLNEMIDREKLVIAEFNFFGSPTSGLVRRKTEEKTDIYWSGWTGTYYDNLGYNPGQEVPLWIIESYNEQNPAGWQYTKSGIIFVNHENTVVVLENETHLDLEVPLVTTNIQNSRHFGVPTVIHYPGRFDVSYSVDTSNVVSYFDIYVNDKGRSLLKKHNIPERFPAVISKNNNRFVYMAGSFSDFKMPAFTSRMTGPAAFEMFYHGDGIGSKQRFFREYYSPFLTMVITYYYNAITTD